ncbi:hypothetical protein TNIN_119051 [Trichonephila inaurata madagascariensis]|uniref:Uncharacterized protein n=1 Tax=Trichonephila inaurata madagascariensis TaxID=2747483 RepID=A0A8X6YVR5_9ARAC|nr:hypothetical protein TNIN_119051 [Trichonephila inaurata madagascariensis]
MNAWTMRSATRKEYKSGGHKSRSSSVSPHATHSTLVVNQEAKADRDTPAYLSADFSLNRGGSFTITTTLLATVGHLWYCALSNFSIWNR